MSAQFGVWPPGPQRATLIGRCTVGTDGVLATTSAYGNGEPVFTSEKLATGEYGVTAARAVVNPSVLVTPLASPARMASVIVSGNPKFAVRTYDAAGAAVDCAFMFELYAN